MRTQEILNQNLHTHTVYCDGKNTPKELVQHAIKLGFTGIGFSGHSHMPYSPGHSMAEVETEGYIAEIKALKEKYRDVIDVFCGIEFDMYSPSDLSVYDYVIGAVHYLDIDGKKVGMDRTADVVKGVIDQYFDGDGMKYAKKFYETVAELPKYGRIDVVAHFDLLAKHCENVKFFDEESKVYRGYALDALHELIKHVDVFEINTGAIARGYRTTPYPAPFILDEIKRVGGRIIISSDCHDKHMLNCAFPEALEYVRSHGFTEIVKFNGSKFVGEKI